MFLFSCIFHFKKYIQLYRYASERQNLLTSYMKMFLIISNPRIIIQLLLFHTKIIVQICNVQRILINWSLINSFTAGYKKSNLYIEINEHPIYLVILKFMQKWYGVQSHIGTNRSKVKDVLLISRFYILHSKIGMKITLIINILISE